MRTVAALDLRAQQNAAAVAHLPDIFRSLVRPEAIGFRARILQQISSSQVLDHTGRPLGSRVSVERDRIDATGERLMRGLHFFEGGQPLSKDAQVYVFSKPGYHDIDFIVPAFTKVLSQCAAQRVREIGPGFSYVAGANGDVFVWLMLLYGYFWWVVAVVPSHVQLPIGHQSGEPQQL